MMGKGKRTVSRRFAILAIVSAVAMFLGTAGFAPGYVPSCDRHPMGPGDSCIGTGGGSYDDMVDAHYRNFHILFWVALACLLFFTFHSIREFRSSRRGR